MSDFQKHLDACGKSSGVTFTDILFLDLETRSKVDLRKTGVEVYAEDPTTEIMCAYFAVNDGPIVGWHETDGVSLIEACPHLADPTTICCFHNAEFEPRILRHTQGIHIPIERILDSAAVSRHAGLPGALEPLGAYFGFKKDMDGNKSMLKLSKPRKPSKTNPDEFWRPDTKPDDFQIMYDYCARDVEVSREAMRRLPPMSPREIDIYAATYKMNERGIPVDKSAAKKMRHIAEATKAQMSAEVAEQFGFTLSQVKELAEFLGLESADKAALRDFLKRDDILPEQRHVAEQRQLFAKSSTAKIDAFLLRSSSDSKIHDGVIYGGAERTLRYSGAGIQPQNIPRGMGEKQDLAFDALNHDAFDVVYDDKILPTISDMLRGLITAKEGLYVGDYSQIEARVLAWFAGDTDLIDAFASGQDPYKMMAGKIYHKPTSEINSWERFLGKQTVLGCLETDTPVLTNSGWKPITKVNTTDLLWDGEEWVSHQGVLFMGLKPTIRRHGIAATSDHKFFVKGEWKPWSEVQESKHAFQSALDSVSLPSLATSVRKQTVGAHGGGTHFVSATPAGKKHHLFPTILKKAGQLGAINVLNKSRLLLEKCIGDMQTSFLMMNIGQGYSTVLHQPINDVRTQKQKPSHGMAHEESKLGSKTEEISSHTSSHLTDGMTLRAKLTASTPMDITKQATFGLLQKAKTLVTRGQSSKCKNELRNLKPVYDILNAGPRNRFTVLTDQGPIIAHNCGYGLGHFGFMSMLDTIYDVQLEETEARSIVQAYRKNAPKIVTFWSKIGTALTQASKQVGKRLKINDKLAIAFKSPSEMHLILPSGRRLRYYDVKHTREHGWVAYGRLPAGQGYGETKIYPGKLTGHIVQSTARDVVSNAMVNLDKEGFPLILTVHDELVSVANGRFDDFDKIMSTPPDWLTDFPLATDAFETTRYRK